MRSPFKATAFAAWVYEKTAASLADARPNIAHDLVMAKAQALIDKKRKQHAAAAAA